jgi:aldehyde oxidoreductase
MIYKSEGAGMTDTIKAEFNVNGQMVSAEVPADMTLLQFLRERLGLTGSKEGCSTGHCGACTVILNGKATRSCLVKMKMRQMAGARVETIEGLARDGKLHPIQAAFLEHGASQCGFCITGMIMAAKALLDENPRPSREEIKAALTGNKNICRCTGYVKIFEAIEDAGRRLAAGEEWPSAEELLAGESMGGSLLRRDEVGVVTGTRQYGDDIEPQNVLYGKILWAAHPHAEILSIDTSQAEAVEGVALVVTAKDVPGKNHCGIVIRDQPAIAFDKVRYIGDPVACVYAETKEIAQAALDEIKVEYKVLPAVFTPEEAARPDAPQVHEKGNLMHHAKIERGDVEGAFARCAHIFEGTYQTPRIEHAFMEPESGLGFPDEDGGVTIKMGSQTVFDDRTQLSEILDMPEEKIRVLQLPQGGSFGAKEDFILQQFLALGALRTGRPIKMTLSRAESLRVHEKRHPAWMRYKTGVDEKGHILAVELDVTLDSGAYASLGVDVLENTLVFGCGPYYVPNVKLEGWAWYTNNVLCGAMRGFGVNQVSFALEQHMDMMARALDMAPFEFRLLNALDVGLPTAADHVMEKGVVAIKETIVAARDAFAKIEVPPGSGHKKIGVGVASAVKNVGFGHGFPESAGAIVEMGADGRCVLKATQHEYGQGARIGLVKLISSELGIPPGQIDVVWPNTAQTPYTGPTTASRQTFLTGNAVVMACRALKDEMFSHAAELLDTGPGKIAFRGAMLVDADSGREVPISELGERFVVERRYTPPASDPLLEGEPSHYGRPDFKSRVTHWCYSYNTQVAIVEVDETTGKVRVLTVISANDVGKALNPPAIERQIYGGVVMGLGYALSEGYYLEQGVNLTDTYGKCGIPTADMVPEIIPVIVEVPHPDGPQGAKGFAEAPSLATAPAIINAIYDAVGVRIDSLPAKPDKVLKAIRSKSGNQ